MAADVSDTSTVTDPGGGSREAVHDVVVIGAGAVGENAAGTAARFGLDVAIVESDLVGGECSYWACMPSKALLRPGEALEAARRSPGADGAATGEMDVAAALQRRNRIVQDWDDSSQEKWLEEEGIDLVRGYARLTGERTLEVLNEDGAISRLRADKAVVLATGSQNVLPEIPGIDQIGVWDSRDATSAQSAPESMLIIGGGTVGVEMAQAWAWLGSRVTIVHRSEHLLSPEEPFAGRELRTALERMGVEVLTEATTRSLARSPGEVAVASVESSDGEVVGIEVEVVVAATGRQARTDDLGLDTVGLTSGDFIEVNRHMQVDGVEGGWLYAVGDVNGLALFTHMGKYQARIAGAHIAGRPAAVSDIPLVPRVIFTSPEVAAVGLTESEAIEAGYDVDSLTHDIGDIAGAATLGKGYSGTVKLVVDRKDEVLVGATFVGPRTGEMIHAATVAIVGRVPLTDLWHAIPSFPTLSEVWLRLLEDYRDQGWDPYS